MSWTRIHSITTALCAVAAAFVVYTFDIPIGAQTAPATAAGGAASRGKVVYDGHCVECHGATGKGDGGAAHLLTPRPRDFTSGKYKIRSTESGSVPTDEDLVRTVTQGLSGTAMPAWQKLLSAEDITAVVGYVKTLSPRFSSEKPAVIPAYVPPAATPARRAPAAGDPIARGAAAYEKLQCGKCHGTDGRATGAVTTKFEDDWRQPLKAADLTEPWTFHGGATTADIYMRFRAGMSGTPMPSFKDAATDAEMWDLSGYIVSMARKPVWDMTADEATALYGKHKAEDAANPLKRGEYLVETLLCTLCHSPIDEERREIPGTRLAGGLHFHIEPFGDFVSYNLTSDKETGLGNWTDAQIKNVLTRGERPDRSRMLPFPMDWASYSVMPPSDIDAIIAYLRTLPPVRNKVPAPKQPFLPVFLYAKFKMLILGQDPPLTVIAGNAGDMKVGGAK
jgi:mono/diheme cytochrome c family protein